MRLDRYKIRNKKVFHFPEFKWKVHIIRKDDTLYRLSEIYQTAVLAIINANPGIDPRQLIIGSRILIPPRQTGHLKN